MHRKASEESTSMIRELHEIVVPPMGTGVVSFDYDCTLVDAASGNWKINTLVLLRAYKAAGFTVVVVTSRFETGVHNAGRVRERLREEGLSDVRVYSAPGEPPTFERAARIEKGDVLVELGALMHFDDWPHCISLKRAYEAGITLVRVPLSEEEENLLDF